MDRTIVPTNFLSWPKIKNLIPDHKLIAMALWQNNFITPCGCYFLDIDMFSAMLGFNKLNVEQAISDFVEKQIIEFDENTSEVLVCDWWRFHKCESPGQINMIQKSVDKIQSDRLKNVFFERIKHVSNKIKDLRSNTTTTKPNSTLNEQQTELPVDNSDQPQRLVGGGLKFPKALDSRLIPEILTILKDQPDAQLFLDELAAVLELKKIKSSATGWLRGAILMGLSRTELGLKKEDERLALRLS